MRGFPGGSVVKILPSNAAGMGSIPDRKAKIPCASWPKKAKQDIKQKQYCKKFNKDFTKMVHIKRKKNLKNSYESIDQEDPPLLQQGLLKEVMFELSLEEKIRKNKNFG